MIKTKGLTTKVKFGTDNKGTIAVHANRNILALQELLSNKKIGDDITMDDVKELPKIEMEFLNVKSIDVLIKALEVIRGNLNPIYQYALAC